MRDQPSRPKIFHCGDPGLEQVLLDTDAMQVLGFLQRTEGPQDIGTISEHVDLEPRTISEILGRLIGIGLASFHPGSSRSPGGYETLSELPEVVSNLRSPAGYDLMRRYREMKKAFLDGIVADRSVPREENPTNFRWLEEQLVIPESELPAFLAMMDDIMRRITDFNHSLGNPTGDGNHGFVVRFRTIEVDRDSPRLGQVHSVLEEEHPKSIERRRRMPRLPLTERQAEVATMVCDGLTNVEIAARLNLSHNTIKSTIRRIYQILGVSRRTELAEAIRAHRHPG